MRKSLLLAALVAMPFAANAQMYPQHIYSNNQTSPGYAVNSSDQVLRLPQGYQPVAVYAPNPNSDIPAQRPTYQPATSAAPVMAASPNMMPQSQDILLTPDKTTTTVVTTTTTSAQPLMPTPVAYKMNQQPRLAPIVASDDGDTVQLRQNCDGGELNHRSRNKAMNTSTTVFNDCLN